MTTINSVVINPAKPGYVPISLPEPPQPVPQGDLSKASFTTIDLTRNHEVSLTDEQLALKREINFNLANEPLWETRQIERLLESSACWVVSPVLDHGRSLEDSLVIVKTGKKRTESGDKALWLNDTEKSGYRAGPFINHLCLGSLAGHPGMKEIIGALKTMGLDCIGLVAPSNREETLVSWRIYYREEQNQGFLG